MFSYARGGSVVSVASAAGLKFGKRIGRRRVAVTPLLCLLAMGAGCAGHHLSDSGSSGGGGSSPTPTPTSSPSPGSGSGTITTIAGTASKSGYTGDSGAATSATLNDPTGLYVDSSGNLYIADHMNNVVRMVTPAGVISTFAGNGTAGYLGDGGLATSAELSGPQSIFGDISGNIYVVESGNIGYSGGNVVRKIDSSGVITTVAGDGTAGYSGDGAAASAAELSAPRGGCIDSSGNIYIADTGNNRIRRIDASTSTISTIAGTGLASYTGDGSASISAALNTPTDVKTDQNTNLYVSDKLNNRVRKLISGSFITTVAGSGTPPNNMGYTGNGSTATLAQLNLPVGLAVDSTGNVYIADYGNNIIRKLTVATGIITTVAGNGTAGFTGDAGLATSAELKTPGGVAVDSSGNIYISDTGNNVIRKVTH